MDRFDLMDEARQKDVYSVRIQDTYRPPASLKIDDSIKARFREAGFYLKWISQDNIRKRMHPQEGYVLVDPSEFDPMELLQLGDVTQTMPGTKAPMVTNGDLVLMKVRIEKAEARRQYYQNRTNAQTQAINKRLADNALEHGGTRSVVRTGKNAHFSKNFN